MLDPAILGHTRSGAEKLRQDELQLPQHNLEYKAVNEL